MMKKNITKILVIIAVITICIGAKVYADYVMNASEVEYTKSDSSKVSVKAALDDLYTKSQEINQVKSLSEYLNQVESLDELRSLNNDISDLNDEIGSIYNELSSIYDELNRLTFSANAVKLTYTGNQSITISNPNSLYITAESSDSTVATVTKNSNTQVTINAKSKEGSAVISLKAKVDNKTFIVKKIGVGVWSGSGTMSVSTAKNIITPENISVYIGTYVSYSPSAGGSWQIFYLDTENKYGDGENTLYIKRSYDSNKYLSTTSINNTYASYYTNQSDNAIKADILADMRKI